MTMEPSELDVVRHFKGDVVRHFKGDDYAIVGMARHTETGEALVLYRPLGKAEPIWARPQSMFFDIVERDGHSGPRFRILGAEDARCKD